MVKSKSGGGFNLQTAFGLRLTSFYSVSRLLIKERGVCEMKRTFAIVMIIALLAVGALSHAGQKTGGDILMEGLLGAGAGAVGGAVSGADSGDLWKGALAGAGVNIVGGALLDSITGEQVGTVDEVRGMPPENAYASGYNEGFTNGFKQGYTQGYKEGLKEGMNP